MSVCSYIIQPLAGKNEAVKSHVKNWGDLFEDDAHQVLVLVTNTPDHSTEKKIQKELEALSDIECLTMTFMADS